jgi:hypothetical protein
LFYVCKDDPRVIVPKKPKWAGRTLNFAHRRSFLVLLMTIFAVVIPFVLHGHISNTIWWGVFLFTILGIVLFYYSFELKV